MEVLRTKAYLEDAVVGSIVRAPAEGGTYCVVAPDGESYTIPVMGGEIVFPLTMPGVWEWPYGQVRAVEAVEPPRPPLMLRAWHEPYGEVHLGAIVAIYVERSWDAEVMATIRAPSGEPKQIVMRPTEAGLLFSAWKLDELGAWTFTVAGEGAQATHEIPVR